MTSPFDRSLEIRALSAAAEEYALRHGKRGTARYRAAWFEFRQRVKTIEDLRRARQAPRPIDIETMKVLKAAIDRAMVIDGAPMANAQLVDPQGQLRIAVHSGFTSEFLKFFEIADETASACGSALRTARAVWVPDITQSSLFAGRPSLDAMLAAGSRAVASVPIKASSRRVIGILSTHHAHPAHWDNRRRLALQDVAQATGRVLEHLAPTAPDEPNTRPAKPRVNPD
jgi:hypothetical protein